jgi:hypothetical protein
MAKLKGHQLSIPGTEVVAPPAPEPAPKLKSWCFGREAMERLEISYDKLKRLRKAGAFKEGHHYRDISAPGAARPTYQYHVPRIEAVLNGKAAKRKTYS